MITTDFDIDHPTPPAVVVNVRKEALPAMKLRSFDDTAGPAKK
jgi:hypothetical protein